MICAMWLDCTLYSRLSVAHKACTCRASAGVGLTHITRHTRDYKRPQGMAWQTSDGQRSASNSHMRMPCVERVPVQHMHGLAYRQASCCISLDISRTVHTGTTEHRTQFWRLCLAPQRRKQSSEMKMVASKPVNHVCWAILWNHLRWRLLLGCLSDLVETALFLCSEGSKSGFRRVSQSMA